MNADVLSLVPWPQQVEMGDGRFVFQPGTSVIPRPASKEVVAVAEYLLELLNPPTGLNLYLGENAHSGQTKAVVLQTGDIDLPSVQEAYQLQVTSERVAIRAASATGLFRGVQTLRQLLPVEVERDCHVAGVEWALPALAIQDWPRFAWRGMHLDVCRHFFPKAFIKKFIELIALHRMNTFHFHLTEDQGWRIEIKKYPLLTSVGAHRSESPKVGDRHQGDGVPYSGYYTQEDIREVVEFAAARHITVIPEIEMPGHSMAALAAYPELGCTRGPYEVATRWGIFKDVYCAGRDNTFNFLQDVLEEVIELFPSEYIHIGGDECPKDRWKECSDCQGRIRAEGLKDEHELQSYFIRRIEKFLNSRGRQIIGWDEILEGGLAPNAAVMSWRGVEGGIAAASANHAVVMTPTSHCYFDYYQSEDKENEPEAIGGYLPLERVYSFEPVPQEVPPGKRSYILGAQGNVWTEYIHTPEQVEYMAIPRMCALSEVAWTLPERKDWASFEGRLREFRERLKLVAVRG